MLSIDPTSVPVIGAILGTIFGFFGLILSLLRFLRDRKKKDGDGRKQQAKTGPDSVVKQNQVGGDQKNVSAEGSGVAAGRDLKAGRDINIGTDPNLSEDVSKIRERVAVGEHRTVGLEGRVSALEALVHYTGGIEKLGATDRLRVHFEAAEQHMKTFRWKDAEAELKTALALPTTPMQRTALYYTLDRARYTPGDLDGALDAIRHSHEAAQHIAGEKERDTATAAALGNIGLVLFTKGDLDGALDHHRRALAIDEKMSNLQGQAANLGNIGLVLQTKGELDGALDHYRRALALYEKMGAGQGEGARIVRRNLEELESQQPSP